MRPLAGIRAITFDLDDTLWDVRPAMLRAEAAQRAWLATHATRLPSPLDEQALARARAVVVAADPGIVHSVTRLRLAVLAAALRSAGYAHADATRLASGAFAAFLAARQDVTPFAGVDELLAALARRYRLGTLSNGNASVARLAIGRHFAFTVSADDVGRSKPDAAIFAAARAHAGVPPAAILHVGDSIDHDVDGARRAGFATAWVRGVADSTPAAAAADITLRSVLDLRHVLLGDAAG
jgi:putative hydrolase of the HAD superfamily